MDDYSRRLNQDQNCLIFMDNVKVNLFRFQFSRYLNRNLHPDHIALFDPITGLKSFIVHQHKAIQDEFTQRRPGKIIHVGCKEFIQAQSCLLGSNSKGKAGCAFLH